MAAVPDNILDWLLERKGLVIFVLFIVVQVVRGFFRTRSAAAPEPTSKPDELEEQRRMQEIQEDIRRRKEERRGAFAPAEAPPPLQHEPEPQRLPRRAETTQMPEPFGGPLRRVLEEIEREMRPQAAPPPPPPLAVPNAAERRTAELVRQEQLAEELRVLEESRMLAKRRATKDAASSYAQSQSEGGLRTAVQGKLFEDLRDPASLRRAVVLREVLGTPVGLR